MCAQCDNASFQIFVVESVEVDGSNYSVVTKDLKDSISMILSGVTFADNYAYTVVMHTGEHVIDDTDAYYKAFEDGIISPEISKSMVFPYFGEPNMQTVLDGHETMMMGLRNGILPGWMSPEEQTQALMYRVDVTETVLDMLFGQQED